MNIHLYTSYFDVNYRGTRFWHNCHMIYGPFMVERCGNQDNVGVFLWRKHEDTIVVTFFGGQWIDRHNVKKNSHCKKTESPSAPMIFTGLCRQHSIAQPTGTHRGQVHVPRHPVPGTVGGRVTDARAVANLLRIRPFADLTSTVGLHDDLNGRVNQCVMFWHQMRWTHKN